MALGTNVDPSFESRIPFMLKVPMGNNVRFIFDLIKRVFREVIYLSVITVHLYPK